MAVPSNVVDLANSSSDIDGRLVTAVDQLLDPADKPAGVSALKSRQVLELLETPQKRQGCVGSPCQSLFDCQAIGCQACFFPGGPPFGVCFFT